MALATPLLGAILTAPVSAQPAAPGSQEFTACGANGSDYTVPAGVTSVQVDELGAGGQGSQSDFLGVVSGAGGSGGELVATIPVTPGQTLKVIVGCPGSGNFTGGAGYGSGNGGGPGTGPVGQNGHAGGGGSAVFDGTGVALAIAGGGGGGGGGGALFDGGGGGAGGDGDNGANGAVGGGTGGRGGAAGGPSGTQGGVATGNATSAGGGGGGGGGYSGGTGGTGGGIAGFGGGGGGGGTSYAEPTATNVSFGNGANPADQSGSVLITPGEARQKFGGAMCNGTNPQSTDRV